ncbi:hypothetical protein D3C72_2276610 [compost metagenome]
MLAVEGGTRMGGDLERTQGLAAVRVQGVELVAAGEPDMFAVPGQPMDRLDARERAVFTNDFGSCVFHVAILLAG